MRMGDIEISFYAPTFVLAWRNKVVADSGDDPDDADKPDDLDE